MRTCHTKKKKTKSIDVGWQQLQVWPCNPQHDLSIALDMWKDSSHTPNAYNLCFQAYQETPFLLMDNSRWVSSIYIYLSIVHIDKHLNHGLAELVHWVNACQLAHAHVPVYRFLGYWQRWRNSWWLRLEVLTLWRRSILVAIKTMLHRLFLYVRCLVTCSNILEKRGWKRMWTAFWWCSLSTK
jgi:hypothetical protein